MSATLPRPPGSGYRSEAMANVGQTTISCAVCGRESRQREVRGSGPAGPPDLDLRPGETMRGTMAYWLQQCPTCGYAAPRLHEATPAIAAVVAGGPYRALLAETSYPPLARRFLCRAMILEETGELHAAAEATLQAAWVADDTRKPDLAREWRLTAVALFRQGPAPDLEQQVRIVDILRRAGDFGAAAAQANALERGRLPEPVDRVVAFERKLIAAGDARAYSVASALPPPAARPHASLRGPATSLPLMRSPPGGGLFAALRRLFRRR
jgi:hypothetical protein